MDTIMMKEGGYAAFARAADCSESSVKAMRSRAAKRFGFISHLLIQSLVF